MAARHPEIPAVVVHRERDARGERDRLDAGNRLEPLGGLFIELTAAILRVLEHRGIGRHDGELLDRKPDVRALRRGETAREKRGQHEQHRGNRHLSHHQRVAQRPAASCPFRKRLLTAKVGDEIGFRGVHRRRESSQEPCDEGRAQREQQHAPVDVHVERQRDGNRQTHRRGHRRHPPGEQRADYGADHRHHDRFGEELAHETAPARANRQPNGDFLLPPGRARQQHAGDIRAGNQQHEADHREEAGRERKHRRIGRGMEVDVVGGFERDAAVLVGRRIRLLEARHQQRQVRVGFLDGLARFQPRPQEHPAIAAAFQPRRAGGRGHGVVHADRFHFERRGGRNPQLRRKNRHHPIEAGRDDADDRVRVAADAERAPDGIGCGAQLADPVAIRDHRDAFGAGHVVRRRERPADRGAHAKHTEIVPRDDFAHRKARAVVEVQRREHRAVAGDVLEHFVLRPKIEIVRVRRRAERAEPRVARENVDETIRRGHGQRLEQQRIGNREECGVEADADGQRRHGDERESRTLAKPAQRKPDVGEKRFEQDPKL